MAKKTSVEYEAMIGGLKRQIDDLEDALSNAKHQWEQWMERAQKAEQNAAPTSTTISYNGFLCPYCGEDICVCPAG